MALTHGDMGQMLGVSRSRVSLAVRALQKKGLIHYLNGQVRILNRDGLEDAACGCHRAIRRAIVGSSRHKIFQFLTESAAHHVSR